MNFNLQLKSEKTFPSCAGKRVHAVYAALMDLKLWGLQRCREEARLTQEQLAEIVGISTISVRRLELGLQSYTETTVKRLAAALAVPPFTLFGYSYPPDANLTAAHRQLLQQASQLDERAAKIMLSQCNTMIAEGMVRQPEEMQPLEGRRRPGRPRSAKKAE